MSLHGTRVLQLVGCENCGSYYIPGVVHDCRNPLVNLDNAFPVITLHEGDDWRISNARGVWNIGSGPDLDLNLGQLNAIGEAFDFPVDGYARLLDSGGNALSSHLSATIVEDVLRAAVARKALSRVARFSHDAACNVWYAGICSCYVGMANRALHMLAPLQIASAVPRPETDEHGRPLRPIQLGDGTCQTPP